MVGTAPKIYDPSEFKPAPVTKQVHHGRTAASWAGSMIALVGFIIGALGLILGSWLMFWIGGALLVIALIATVILRKIGMGAV